MQAVYLGRREEARVGGTGSPAGLSVCASHDSTGDLVCDPVCDSRLVFLPLSGSQTESGKRAAFEQSSSEVKVGGGTPSRLRSQPVSCRPAAETQRPCLGL